MKVLFAVCSWGLGHATRDLPFIRRILQSGYQITLVGSGRSLQLLKDELGNQCKYLDIPDYSSAYSKKNFSVTKLVGYFPLYVNEITQEHLKIKELVEQEGYDRIISDNRFGVYARDVPSYFLSHQLRFISPGRVKLFERITEGFNYLFKDNFVKFLIPDSRGNSLSGELSHHLRYFKSEKIKYLGIPLIVTKRDLPLDIDYFISISGPEPQRTTLEKKIMSQLDHLNGRTVIALGKPEDPRIRTSGGIRIFGYLSRQKQEEMMNRSKLIIARSGYTTLMEVVLLGKKALFIPTPGQTEQEYLAEYHQERGNFFSVSQDELDLPVHIQEARKYEGIRMEFSPLAAEEKFMKIVFG